MPSSVLLASLAVLLVAALAALAFFVQRRRLARRLARLPPRLRHPVVLAHGILGFDELKLGGVKNAYFRGVEPKLVQLGARVYAFQVHPAATVAARAEELAQAIRELDAERVNIVAHSMGGLDARYLASRLGLSRRIASIVTVGTPHRGTPLADLGTGLFGVAPTAQKLLGKLGVDVGGFFDLTTEKMARFNHEVPDVEGIFYGSFVARAPGSVTAMNPLLLPTWKLIHARAGDNDGLVPLESQRWGEVLGTIDADHWAQIGWSGTFDAPAFYEALVRELMKRGL
jgi:triacylglycerol lipase